MKQPLANQNPVLQVIFSNQLETPKLDEALQLLDNEAIVDFQEYIFGDSIIK